jgi:hypothetical protein
MALFLHMFEIDLAEYVQKEGVPLLAIHASNLSHADPVGGFKITERNKSQSAVGRSCSRRIIVVHVSHGHRGALRVRICGGRRRTVHQPKTTCRTGKRNCAIRGCQVPKASNDNKQRTGMVPSFRLRKISYLVSKQFDKYPLFGYEIGWNYSSRFPSVDNSYCGNLSSRDLTKCPRKTQDAVWVLCFWSCEGRKFDPNIASCCLVSL